MNETEFLERQERTLLQQLEAVRGRLQQLRVADARSWVWVRADALVVGDLVATERLRGPWRRILEIVEDHSDPTRLQLRFRMQDLARHRRWRTHAQVMCRLPRPCADIAEPSDGEALEVTAS